MLTARLLRDGAPLTVHSVVEDDPDRLVRLRFSGPGAPTGEVVIPTRYGGTVPLRVLSLRGREVLLAEMDGNGGTGISQKIGVLVGVDDSGRLRVIGIENLEILDSTTCESEASLRGTVSEASAGQLRLSASFHRRRGECGFRWRGRPHRERWQEALSWDGRGILSAERPPRGAGPVRLATSAARTRVLALLAAPVTDLRRVRLERTGIYDLAAYQGR
ncbi:hypothetical protein VQH23_12520 [Pararoseomonas sp. SCSIO 73927]|uniref:hypothetical protein n=1 Tax=Pararoseomonas sp. SCSIO 73927 TaxID=3114537 RepID=UPI0030CCC82B